MDNEKTHKRGAYGSITLSASTGTAVKRTRLFDKYSRRDRLARKYLLACNLREAVFMRELVERPIEGLIHVHSVVLRPDGVFEATMQAGDCSLFDFVQVASLNQRLHQFDNVFRQVAEGLHNMHLAGVVHGDLKPENVVRVERDVFRIVDFGGVAWYKQRLRHSSLCTYVTRAPELFEESQFPTPISDAYSLGASMYYYLTRRYLVDDSGGSDMGSVDSMEYVAVQHASGNVSLRLSSRRFPSRIRNLVKALLNPDPSTRMSCQECLESYFGFPPTGQAAGDKDYTVSTQAQTARELRMWRQDADTASRVCNMLKSENEVDAVPMTLAYLRWARAALPSADLNSLMCASRAIARAVLYDADTCVQSSPGSLMDTVMAILSTTDLRLPPQQALGPVRSVAIDGNIGASKSTVMTRLQASLEPDTVELAQEPVQEWTELLSRYYDDPARWGCALHARVMLSFSQLHFARHARRPAAPKLLVTERSAWTCLRVFQDLLLQDGLTTVAEHEVIADMYGSMPGLVPDVIVYLRCSPEQCAQRAHHRGRCCEESMPVGYVVRLHEQYERVMDTEALSREGIILHVVDTTDKSPEQVESQVLDILLKYM